MKFCKVKRKCWMIFCQSWQDPNSPHYIRPYPICRQQKTPLFPSAIISIRKKNTSSFFQVVKLTKEATKLALIFPCRNTSSQSWCRLQDQRWSSNRNPTGHRKLQVSLAKSEKTGKRSTKTGKETAKTWFHSLQELPRLISARLFPPVQRFEKVA